MQNALVLLLALGSTPLLPLVATFYFFWVRSRHRSIPAQAGLTGREAAQRILAENHISDVTIDSAHEIVGDHFDPRSRKIGLTRFVLDDRSVFALAVAAHECGHVLQQKDGYRYFVWWMSVAPYAHIATFVLQMLFLALAVVWKPAILMLAVLFGGIFVLSIIALPMEYDASRRALRELDRLGLIRSPEERGAMRSVLIAAGLTYVARALMDLCLALYYAISSRSRD
jgi:Zn-dependent membrane protease YugP